MSPFVSAVAAWHDFFLAVSSASAALLGLLFVGVSIGLASVPAADRAELRIRAGQAFANLSLILVLSLLLLIPDQSSETIAIQLAIVGAFGLVGMVRRIAGLFRSSRASAAGSRLYLSIARRTLWSAGGNAVLLVVAYLLWRTAPTDADVLYWLLFVIFMFLMGAAEVSWGLLVQVSEERTRVSG